MGGRHTLRFATRWPAMTDYWCWWRRLRSSHRHPGRAIHRVDRGHVEDTVLGRRQRLSFLHGLHESAQLERVGRRAVECLLFGHAVERDFHAMAHLRQERIIADDA